MDKHGIDKDCKDNTSIPTPGIPNPGTPTPDDTEAWLRLQHCEQIPAFLILNLVKKLGSPDAVLRAHPRELATAPSHTPVQRDLRWLASGHRRHIVSWMDERYPTLLREIPDAPLLLYVEGNPELLDTPQIAIVGSRNPTPGGRELAFRFSVRLSRSGLTVTSGLAMGIDAAAHHGALSTAKPTLAVMATGIDRIYPPRHRSLARDIAQHGALVSELPVGTPPRKEAFPKRNRIISGLSVGTLVVEAAKRSGSLITARLAGEQGREVYAVPGSVLSPQSRGCHALIKDGACLVETEADVFAELKHLRLATPDSLGPASTGKKSHVLMDAMGYDPVTIDTLVNRSGLTADTVSSMLLRMELEGAVKAIAGGHYIRVE